MSQGTNVFCWIEARYITNTHQTDCSSLLVVAREAHHTLALRAIDLLAGAPMGLDRVIFVRGIWRA